MDEKVISILKDKPVVIPRILLNNYKKLNISDSELIIIMVLLSFGDKITYNPEEFAKEINGDKHQVMNVINNLIHKNIISLEKIGTYNGKYHVYLILLRRNLEELYRQWNMDRYRNGLLVVIVKK